MGKRTETSGRDFSCQPAGDEAYEIGPENGPEEIGRRWNWAAVRALSVSSFILFTVRRSVTKILATPVERDLPLVRAFWLFSD